MASASKQSEVKIRRARSSDAPRLAVLAGELGYPTSANEMKVRLNRVMRAADDIVLVAEKNSSVIGWLHLSVIYQLESWLFAEIDGLIVAEGQRSAGAGAKLLDVGEEWARKKKCASMLVRSNVIRERAHAFYERQGFEHFKTSKVFRKPL
jgi:N-acetylglutamate synthase-like GNAT family acetyltransferase